jgi:two-component system, OmpR family, alkaline phosphatase synthesis response regulator PhoP
VSTRVIVVEDQVDLADLLAHNLRLEGFEVRTVSDGREVMPLVRAWAPDLVLLDLMLTTRGHRTDLPVIILSARGEEHDRIRAFRLDTDQYVTKPFSLVELLERVHALLRRQSARAGGAAEGTITFGDIAIDPAARTARRAGAPVVLSPKAFDLLLALVRREGRVASRVELLREVWGYGPLVMSRTVDSHIVELRRKLEDDPAQPRHFRTVFKSGYRFER